MRSRHIWIVLASLALALAVTHQAVATGKVEQIRHNPVDAFERSVKKATELVEDAVDDVVGVVVDTADASETLLTAFKYGKWCGPFRPGSGENPEPVDEIDEACRRHDSVYHKKPSGEADAELARELVDLMESGNLDDEQFASAAIIAAYMTGQQNVTVLFDVIVDGKVSSAVEVALATRKMTVVLPATVTAYVLDEVAGKVGGPGGLVIETGSKAVRVPVKALKEVGRAWKELCC